MDKRIIALALLALASLQLANSSTEPELMSLQKTILTKLLADISPEHKLIPPLNGTYGDPVIVLTNMFIENIASLDESNRQWTVQLKLRHQWNDGRLAYDDHSGAIEWINIPPDLDSSKIWFPDTFFKNEKAANYHDVLKRNEFIWLYPSGEVFYSTRLTLTLSCPMWFGNFPEDVQICSIDLASYGYTTKSLIYKFIENAVHVSPNLTIDKFRLEKFTTNDCTDTTPTGSYSCKTTQFLFRRVSCSYFTQIYLPFTILLITSWLAFWIDARKQLFSRLFLNSSTLFVIICLAVHLNGSFPATTYTRRIDTWTTACLVFTFVALLETAVVHYAIEYSDEEETQKSNRLRQILHPLARPLDRIARIAFPVLFVLFLIYYLLSSNVGPLPNLREWNEYTTVY